MLHKEKSPDVCGVRRESKGGWGAAVPVSGIVRAGGRPGLGERVIRDNLGPRV